MGRADTDRDTTPARRQVLHTVAWLAGYVVAALLGRIIVLDNNVNVVSPAAGVALVWLASSSRRMLPVDAVLLGLSTMAVIALTDGGTARTILSVIVVLQTLLALWLMRRLVPGIWGTGGRVPFTRLPQFGWLLVSILLAAITAAVVRTLLGVAVTGDGWHLVIGRFGRQGSAMSPSASSASCSEAGSPSSTTAGNRWPRGPPRATCSTPWASSSPPGCCS